MPDWTAFVDENPNRALAYFTLVLILLTAFYAAMTYRMARLMAGDLRLRIRPFVRVTLNRLADQGNTRNFSVAVMATKGIAIVRKVAVVFAIQGVPRRDIVVELKETNAIIAEGNTATFSDSFQADKWPDYWFATVEISDALGKYAYSHLASQGDIINYPTVGHITSVDRLVMWIRRKKHSLLK